MIQKVSFPVQFLIAKYVPDLRRMEPRNVGVVVWSEGNVCSRFAGEDSRRPRGMPSDGAYDDWVGYWQHQLKKEFGLDRSGKKINRSDDRFVEFLEGKSKRQFRLVNAGGLLDPVEGDALLELTDQLFNEMVSPINDPNEEPPQRSNGQRLYSASQRLIKRAGLYEVAGFQEKYDYVCRVHGTAQRFQFDYGVHDRGPQLAMSRVSDTAESLYASAFQFEQILNSDLFGREHLASLVFADDQDLKKDRVRDSHEMLSSMSTVINLADEDSAVDLLSALVA